MIIALKDKEGIYVGVSARNSFIDMNPKDMLLDDNLPIWKIPGHKGWYVVCGKLMTTTDLLRYTKGLFAKEITHQSLIRHTVPMMRALLSERGLIKDKNWGNTAIVFNAERAYAIDSYLCVSEITDIETNGMQYEITRGCLEFAKGLTAKMRIREAFGAVNELRGRNVFPVVLVDGTSGKRETWWSYQDALSKAEEKISK